MTMNAHSEHFEESSFSSQQKLFAEAVAKLYDLARIHVREARAGTIYDFMLPVVWLKTHATLAVRSFGLCGVTTFIISNAVAGDLVIAPALNYRDVLGGSLIDMRVTFLTAESFVADQQTRGKKFSTIFVDGASLLSEEMLDKIYQVASGCTTRTSVIVLLG